jgi:hypothetical protein
MPDDPKAQRAPITLNQAEVEAIIAGRGGALRAISRRLKAATPSTAQAEGGRTGKPGPVAIKRSELRALAAGKPMPAAVKKRLEAAGRSASDMERREPALKKEEADQPTRKPDV